MARRVKGEGSIYQRSDGRWIGVLDLGWVGGKRVRKTVTAATLRELRPKFKALKERVEQGVLTDDTTVGEWLDYWLDHVAPMRNRERTIAGYRSYVETWLRPTLGRKRLADLRPDHVRALHEAMDAEGKSAATRRQAHMILRRALVVAERDGRISRNPAALVDPPPMGTTHHGYHTPDEAKAVIRTALDTANLALTCRVLLAYLTGMRQGEALALLWSDVDLEDGVAHVHQSLTRVKGQGLVIGKVKSDASVRFVPLVAPLVEALRAYRDTTDGTGYVFGGVRPLDPRKDWQAWKDTVKAAGAPDVPLHGARASCASLLRELGASERVIADLLGHAQVATTQAHYIRSHDLQRREALESAGRKLLEP